MSELTLTLILVCGMLVLLASGIPVAFALLTPALVVLYLGMGTAGFGALASIAWSHSTSFILTAIPLFVFLAAIFEESGLADDIYTAATTITSGLKGGLAAGSSLACGIFAAVCGSSAATAATMGMIAVPSLKRRGYSPALATGCLAAGGTLGILIPPSLPMIIIGDMTDQSVGKLFMAGFGPGIVNMLLLAAVSLLWGWRRPHEAPADPSVSLLKRILALRKIWSALVIILVVMGGIYMGIMTPSESAGVGAAAALVLMIVKHRGVPLRLVRRAAVSGIRTTSWIMMLLIGGYTFGFALTYLRIPMMVTDFIGTMDVNPWVILIMLNLVLIVMGMLMDQLTMLLISIPIMFPIIVSLGFDPIWFVALFVINCEVANITPPVGVNLFVIQGVTKTPFGTVAKGVTPFTIALVLGMVILCLFPQLALWLPGTMK